MRALVSTIVLEAARETTSPTAKLGRLLGTGFESFRIGFSFGITLDGGRKAEWTPDMRWWRSPELSLLLSASLHCFW